jgi:hypothetical protein
LTGELGHGAELLRNGVFRQVEAGVGVRSRVGAAIDGVVVSIGVLVAMLVVLVWLDDMRENRSGCSFTVQTMSFEYWLVVMVTLNTRVVGSRNAIQLMLSQVQVQVGVQMGQMPQLDVVGFGGKCPPRVPFYGSSSRGSRGRTDQSETRMGPPHWGCERTSNSCRHRRRVQSTMLAEIARAIERGSR